MMTSSTTGTTSRAPITSDGPMSSSPAGERHNTMLVYLRVVHTFMSNHNSFVLIFINCNKIR